MPRKLTCEGVVNSPVPNIDQVVGQLRAMHDDQTPVTARAIARTFGLVEGAIAPVLRLAEQYEKVRKVDGRGWMVLET